MPPSILVRSLIIAALLSCWVADGNPPETRTMTDKDYGLEATVVVFAPEENRGFTVLDVPTRIDGDNIRAHWQSNCVLMCNGNFFDTAKFTPAAFCRLNGTTVNSNVSPRWSGFIGIDANGKLHLLWRGENLSPYHCVLQTGPYVIDPGGRIGIYSRSGEKARRTLVGLTETQEVVFMITEPIDLYDLAQAAKKNFPRLERLLNLDGGPSTGFKTPTVEITNHWPVRNYLVKKE